MSEETPKDPIAAQYERWAFPDPRLGVEQRAVWNDPGTWHPLMWPRTGLPSPLRILVAGCGTSEAAALALRNPTAEVIGIDVSAAALRHEEVLAAQHGLGNLRLQQLPLEQVEVLGLDFDLVAAAGVLHHLADPPKGLRALADVLKPEGVVVAAVYSQHARGGVYLMQAFFAELGLGQSPQDVELLRATLAALPPGHPAQAWVENTGSTGAPDAHLVDTWLNARDRAYTVPQILELVEGAGLSFQGWFHNALYHPEGLLPPEHPLFARLDALPEPQRWAAMERLRPYNDHCFIACRQDRPAGWRLDFEAADFFDWVPGRRWPDGLRHPPVPYDPRQPVQEALYRPIDGQRSVAQVLDASGVSGPRGDLEGYARAYLRALWRKDAVYFRLPPLARAL